jgi:eukaryotic-like serine/threonine-protein kinase
MSCLAKAPSDRPQSMTEILQVLESLEQEELPQTNLANDAPTQAIAIREAAQQKVKANLAVSVSSQSASDVVSLAWPGNKPIADIVFPQLIQCDGQTLPALWIMLSQQEIIKRIHSKIYNQFLFIHTPHPMLLWITVIYNRLHGAKFLPYYLDMKTLSGQEMASLLALKGGYRLLLFAREAPKHCSHVLVSQIDPAQPQRLQEWVAMSRTFPSSADPQLSKTLLKAEYEKIKPTILAKLQRVLF